MAAHSSNMYEYCLARLASSGNKVTTPRQVVLQVLCELHGHCTSTEILSKVAELDAGISRASVFRVLELFSRLAIVRPTYVNSSTPEYVLLPENGHHAHIVCPGCNKVTEISMCLFEEQLEQVAAQHGIQLTGHILELFGYCETCSIVR
jgi:Fur family transcriptional regulator, ferric uptake regulator